MTRLVKSAFDQIRQAAAANPAVSIRLLRTFALLANQSKNPRFHEALVEQTEAVWEAASTREFVKADRADIETAYRRACAALDMTE
jgi:uncharacterized membrane protein